MNYREDVSLKTLDELINQGDKSDEVYNEIKKRIFSDEEITAETNREKVWRKIFKSRYFLYLSVLIAGVIFILNSILISNMNMETMEYYDISLLPLTVYYACLGIGLMFNIIGCFMDLKWYTWIAGFLYSSALIALPSFTIELFIPMIFSFIGFFIADNNEL